MSADIERPFFRTLLRLRPPRMTLARGAVVAVLLLALGAAHHLGGANVGLYAFFVLPCALAAWAIGPAAGVLAAVASTAIIFGSDLRTQTRIAQADLALNAVLRLGLYVLIAWGTAIIGGLLDRLHALSRTDALTGLANGPHLRSRGTEEIERSRRTQRPFSLLYVDLDGFKAVNDTLGHAAGDETLRRVGAVLDAQSRSIDVPARIGGDEFVVLLPETDGKGASRAAQKLLQSLRAEFSGTRHAVSASIGAATFPIPPASIDEALRYADELMYCVKKGTRNAVAQRDFSSPQATSPSS